MHSQNGWTASDDRTAIGIVPFNVNGVTFPNGVRNGDVLTILSYVAERYHRTVEPLHPYWCWGYYFKLIEGSSALSNHASGTAIDINSPRHPMGKRGTFTAAQVQNIRRILLYCEGAVRWGGDYSGRPDEMHWEINAAAPVVARIAVKIRGTVIKPPSGNGWTAVMIDNMPSLREGDNGEDVQTWQGILNARGQSVKMDSDFGPATKKATIAVQKRYGAESVDGVVGPETWTIGLRRKDLR